MADDATGAKKAPTVLRIKLRYDDLDSFVEKFAPNIGRAGLFIRTRTPKPVGAEVRFELRLSDDKPVVIGLGIVRWIRDYDPRRPRAVHGMGVEFTRVTKESREVLMKVLEFRKRHGLIDGERGLPVPVDEDDAVVRPARDDHSAPIEASHEASGPVTAPIKAPSDDGATTVRAAPTARPAKAPSDDGATSVRAAPTAKAAPAAKPAKAASP
ncbi:MAG: TIGR02266 family protein, partial [Deltaproteobacteria bacterium]|nr:TIGR02266 family protein [Deltaproteobacteria bacterium]